MNNIYINKYFKKRSLKNIGKTHKSIKREDFKFLISIPCYNEFNYIFDTLNSIDKQNKKLLKDTLVIIVINNSIKETRHIKKNNEKTYQKLINQKYNFNFIVIDCFSENYAISEKLSGVGYARKIGLDFALNYVLDENSILCNLDADTIINKNYLKIIKEYFNKKINAAVINFKHQKSNNPTIEEGIRKYENSIKSIANKIKKTGSPYGYVSMGSTIVCNVKSYVACGGMNTKKATEDFYFLQALAKYTKIYKINEILVSPSSRKENRVYLGTGFRMNEYVRNSSFKNLNFSDDAYLEISKIIKISTKHWSDNYNVVIKKMCQRLNAKSIDFLIEKNFENIWKKFRNNAKSKKQFLIFFHQWFDALSIMKLLKKISN